MTHRRKVWSGRSAGFLVLLLILVFAPRAHGEGETVSTVRVASWNLRNYLLTDRLLDGQFHREYPKPETEKTALRAVLEAVSPDVLAVQEIGDERFLRELQRDLRTEGLDYPHVAWMAGQDEARHLAVLSRLPFAEVIPHETVRTRFLQRDGVVKRGTLEVVFKTQGVTWRLFNLHLKSRFSDDPEDPESLERRNAEAAAIREIVRVRVEAEPAIPVFVVGDFNDHRSSRPLRRFLEINERPFLEMFPAADDRGDTWTLHYAHEDRYERIDFVLGNPPAAALLDSGGVVIPDSPEMRQASDHRLLSFALDFERFGVRE